MQKMLSRSALDKLSRLRAYAWMGNGTTRADDITIFRRIVKVQGRRLINSLEILNADRRGFCEIKSLQHITWTQGIINFINFRPHRFFVRNDFGSTTGRTFDTEKQRRVKYKCLSRYVTRLVWITQRKRLCEKSWGFLNRMSSSCRCRSRPD